MAKEEEKKVVTPARKPRAKAQTQFTEEELENLIKNFHYLEGENGRLKDQNQMLKAKLDQAAEQIKFLSMGEVHKKLEWLWKVITLEDNNEIFGEDFVTSCTQEFKDILTPEEEPETEETK